MLPAPATPANQATGSEPPMNGPHSNTSVAKQSVNHFLPDSADLARSYREIIRRTRLTLPELFGTLLRTNRSAQRWLIQQRWPDGPRCAHCGSTEVGEVTPQDEDAEIRFRCESCGEHFTVLTNHFTAYPDVSFRHWALAMYLTVSEPQFWSEEQLARFLGLDQRTTYLVVHAIHLQVTVSDLPPLESLEGVFEADEACWPKHMKSAEGERFTQRLYTILALERASRQVRLWVVSDRCAGTIKAILRWSGVRRGHTPYSDGWEPYLRCAIPHGQTLLGQPQRLRVRQHG